jgi:hypothetical protein
VVPLHKLRESEKLQSAVGSSYERMRLRGLKRLINISLRRNKTELRFADEQQADCNHSAIMF